MADDDDFFDARRGGGQRLGHAGAQVGDGGGVKGADAVQRLAQFAHHVGGGDGDLALQASTNGVEEVGGIPLGAQNLFGDAQRVGERDEPVQRGVGVGLLEGGDLGVAAGAIGGDDDAGARVLDAVGQRLVGKAAEHGGVDDAQPFRPLGPDDLVEDVGHVQRDAVALRQAEILQRLRGQRRADQQLAAGQGDVVDGAAASVVGRRVPAVALVPEGDLRPVAGQDVAVHLVEGGVGAGADEPAVEGGFGAVERLGPGRPVAPLGRFAGRGVPAPPHAVALARQPGGAVEPVDRLRCDGAVEGAGIGLAGGALGLPVGGGADRVDRHVLRQRRREGLAGGSCGGGVHLSLPESFFLSGPRRCATVVTIVCNHNNGEDTT